MRVRVKLSLVNPLSPQSNKNDLWNLYICSALSFFQVLSAPSMEGAMLSIDRAPFYTMALLLGIPRWRSTIYGRE